MPDPSRPKTFEDYLREVMAGGSIFVQIGLYSRGYGVMLLLPRGDGESTFAVDGNKVEPLTEPKGG